jgi:hypothetical protein
MQLGLFVCIDLKSAKGRPIKSDPPTLPSNRIAGPLLSLNPHQCCPLPLAGIPANAFPI